MGGLPEENRKGWECPLSACCTVSTGWERVCWRGYEQCRVPFIKQRSQDCGSLSTFGKARKVNKIRDAFCCSKNAVTVVVSCELKAGENKWCLSFFGFPFSLHYVCSLIPHKTCFFTSTVRQMELQNVFSGDSSPDPSSSSDRTGDYFPHSTLCCG